MSDAKPFSFDFGTGGASRAESESLGADQGNGAPTSIAPEVKEASAHLDQVRKRGRPSKAERSVEQQARDAAIRDELAKEFHQLFDPEQWGAICRGPADLMLHISKRDLWRIEDRELKPLSVGAAHTARLFLQTDPKWIALFMFSVSLLQIYGARTALHLAQSRKEEKERKEKEPTKAV